MCQNRLEIGSIGFGRVRFKNRRVRKHKSVERVSKTPASSAVQEMNIRDSRFMFSVAYEVSGRLDYTVFSSKK